MCVRVIGEFDQRPALLGQTRQEHPVAIWIYLACKAEGRPGKTRSPDFQAHVDLDIVHAVAARQGKTSLDSSTRGPATPPMSPMKNQLH